MSVQKAQPSSKPSNLMYCLSNFRQKPGLKLSIKIILPIIAHTKKSQKVQVTSHNCTSVCLKRKEKKLMRTVSEAVYVKVAQIIREP